MTFTTTNEEHDPRNSGAKVLLLDRHRGLKDARRGGMDMDAVVRLHGRALYGWALHLTADQSEAWDLVQDTYERALRDGSAGVPAEKARGWLFVIMRNLFLDRWRARKRRPTVQLDGEGVARLPSPEPEAPPPWSALGEDDVRKCVSQLSGRLRRVYELHVLEGLSYAEISSRLRLPAGTIGTRLFRAREKLRKALSDEVQSAAA